MTKQSESLEDPPSQTRDDFSETDSIILKDQNVFNKQYTFRFTYRSLIFVLVSIFIVIFSLHWIFCPYRFGSMTYSTPLDTHMYFNGTSKHGHGNFNNGESVNFKELSDMGKCAHQCSLFTPHQKLESQEVQEKCARCRENNKTDYAIKNEFPLISNNWLAQSDPTVFKRNPFAQWTAGVLNNEKINLKFSIVCYTPTHLAIKIRNIDSKEFELPFEPPFYHLEQVNGNKEYQYLYNDQCEDRYMFSVNDFTHSIDIIRKSNNEVIFSFRDLIFLSEQRFRHFKLELASYEVFGFGSRVGKALLNDGVYTIQMMDQNGEPDTGKRGENSSGQHPVYLTKEKSGQFYQVVYLRATNSQEVILSTNKKKNTRNINWASTGGIIDLHIFASSTPDAAISEYHRFNGGWVIPPFWSFGTQTSQIGQFNSVNDIEHLIEQYDNNDHPLEVFAMDCTRRREIFVVLWNTKILIFKQNISTIKQAYSKNLKPPTFKLVAKEKTPFSKFPNCDYGNCALPYVNTNKYKSADLRKLFKVKKVKSIVLVDSYLYTRSPSYFKEVGYDPLDYHPYLLQFKDKTYWDKIYFISRTGPVVVDFAHPGSEEWWDRTLQMLHRYWPFDGIWLDANEPSVFYIYSPRGQNRDRPVKYYPGNPPGRNERQSNRSSPPTESLHYGGIYEFDAKCMTQLFQSVRTHFHMLQRNDRCYEAYKTKLGKKPICKRSDIPNVELPKKQYLPYVLTRASSPMTISYATSYAPDALSKEPLLGYAITHLIKYNIFGFVQAGTGVCGELERNYVKTPNNLCARWYQLSVFSPLFRNHHHEGASVAQEPFRYPNSTQVIMRDAVKLRYSLLHYLYSRFMARVDLTIKKGVGPIIEHVFMSYNVQEDQIKNPLLETQFTVGGGEILVGAQTKILNKQLLVYFPFNEIGSTAFNSDNTPFQWLDLRDYNIIKRDHAGWASVNSDIKIAMPYFLKEEKILLKRDSSQVKRLAELAGKPLTLVSFMTSFAGYARGKYIFLDDLSNDEQIYKTCVEQLCFREFQLKQEEYHIFTLSIQGINPTDNVPELVKNTKMPLQKMIISRVDWPIKIDNYKSVSYGDKISVVKKVNDNTIEFELEGVSLEYNTYLTFKFLEE